MLTRCGGQQNASGPSSTKAQRRLHMGTAARAPVWSVSS